MPRERPTPAVAAALHLLPPACIARSDGRQVPLSPRNAALLALVALAGALPRHEVAALLAPGQPADAARNRLRQVLHKLSRAAGTPLLQGETHLDLAPGVTHDLHGPLDPEAPLRALFDDQVLTEWPALAEALVPRLARWHAARIDTALARLDTLEAADRGGDALQLALRLLEGSPLDERCVAAAMRLHWRTGDPAAALALHARFERRLNDEQQAAPGPALQQLAQRIRAAAPATPEAAGVWVPALRHPPFTFGRDEVVRRAERLWASEGVVLLSGPAGIGKSRLFEDLVQRWKVAIVLRGRAPAAASHGGLRALCETLLATAEAADVAVDPPLQALLSSTTAPPPAPVLASALRRWLDLLAGAGHVALAIDDLQDLDEESLEVLQAAWPLQPGRVRWLLACRDTPLPAAADRWLHRRGDAPLPELSIGPLDRPALREWLCAVGVADDAAEAWAASLQAHVGGHPWSVLQVLREFDLQGLWTGSPPDRWPVPQEALLRLGRQLDRADEPTRRLAWLLAIAGVDFDDRLAAAVLDCRAIDLVTPWRRLQDLGVLRDGRIAHALYGQALQAGVPTELQAPLHRDVARAMQGLAVPAERRAPHFEAAGDDTAAAADYATAALDARRVGLMGKALALHRKAAQFFRRVDDRGRAFEAACAACGLTVVVESAQAALAEVDLMQAAAEGPRQRCLAACQRSYVLTHLYDPQGLDAALEAVALAGALADPALAARAHLREGLARHVAGDAAGAIDVLQPLLAGGQLEADDRLEAEDTLASALAAVGRRREAVGRLRQLHDDALRQQDWPRAASTSSTLSVHWAHLCRPREAVQALQVAIDCSTRAQNDAGLMAVDEASMAGYLADLGEFGAALARAESALAALRRDGYAVHTMNTEHLLAAIFETLGRFDLAFKLLRTSSPEAPPWMHAVRQMHRARLAGLRGEPALPLARRAFDTLEAEGVLGPGHLRWRMELEVARWSPAGARATRAEACRAWARRHEHVALERLAWLLEIEGRLDEGDAGRAATLADDLAADLQPELQADGGAVAVNFYLPELWRAQVRAWEGAGRMQAADALAARACAWIAQVAAEHVPLPFQTTFLSNNPVNTFFRARGRR